MKNITVEAKLPIGWNEAEQKVISDKVNIEVAQCESLEDAIEHFKTEEDLLKFLNSALLDDEKSRQYQRKLAAVKPSDLSVEDRVDRAVNAMLKTGFFTEETARKVISDRIAAGENI